MSKFWYTVGTVFIVALVLLLVVPTEAKGIEFMDIETECRYDRAEQSIIQLNRDDTLSFSGHFRVDSTESDVRYNYRKTSDSVVLNMKTTDYPAPDFFWSDCLGLAVYDGQTEQLEEGSYHVKLKHEGRLVEEQIIEVE